MKYNYAVKVNGVWYAPNTEIPEPKKKATAPEKEKSADKK